jgi:hypothetical protein
LRPEDCSFFNLFQEVTLEEPTFQEIILIYRKKTKSEVGGEEGREKVADDQEERGEGRMREGRKEEGGRNERTEEEERRRKGSRK